MKCECCVILSIILSFQTPSMHFFFEWWNGNQSKLMLFKNIKMSQMKCKMNNSWYIICLLKRGATPSSSSFSLHFFLLICNFSQFFDIQAHIIYFIYCWWKELFCTFFNIIHILIFNCCTICIKYREAMSCGETCKILLILIPFFLHLCPL